MKERLRKVKENEKRLEREKKRLDIENEKNQKKLKELNNIIQTKETFKTILTPTLILPSPQFYPNLVCFPSIGLDALCVGEKIAQI